MNRVKLEVLEWEKSALILLEALGFDKHVFSRILW